MGGDEPAQEGCFLCHAAAETGAPAGHVVERTGDTITLLNRFPYNSGHVMVAPRRHAPDLLSLDDSEAAVLVAAVRRAVRAIVAALRPDGYNVGVNAGDAAGASVDHLHVHVVPRWSGDTNFMPVLADAKVLPEHLDATALKLREAYSTL